QSYIAASNGGWATLWETNQELLDESGEIPVVENKLGKFGALLANQFIYNWFGVSSFLFVLILFVTGYKLLYKRSLLPVWKTTLYALLAILILSVTFGFAQDFISPTPHILEGKFGYWTNQILKAQIGIVGTAGLLIFIYLAVLVLLYNLDLKWTFQTSKNSSEEEEFEEEEGELEAASTVYNSVRQPSPSPSATPVKSQTAAPITPIQDSHLESQSSVVESSDTATPSPKQTNTLRNESLSTGGDTSPAIELSIDPPTEKSEKTSETEDLELTVEAVTEEQPITANALVEKFGEYDPKLDLSGYQYPGLDLLTDYASGKITINQEELEANKNRIVETLRNYNIEIEHIKATIGPTVTLYEIIPKPGVRISKIKNLEDDIALSLAALGIRIIAPMPGKGTI